MKAMKIGIAILGISLLIMPGQIRADDAERSTAGKAFDATVGTASKIKSTVKDTAQWASDRWHDSVGGWYGSEQSEVRGKERVMSNLRNMGLITRDGKLDYSTEKNRRQLRDMYEDIKGVVSIKYGTADMEDDLRQDPATTFWKKFVETDQKDYAGSIHDKLEKNRGSEYALSATETKTRGIDTLNQDLRGGMDRLSKDLTDVYRATTAYVTGGLSEKAITAIEKTGKAIDKIKEDPINAIGEMIREEFEEQIKKKLTSGMNDAMEKRLGKKQWAKIKEKYKDYEDDYNATMKALDDMVNVSGNKDLELLKEMVSKYPEKIKEEASERVIKELKERGFIKDDSAQEEEKEEEEKIAEEPEEPAVPDTKDSEEKADSKDEQPEPAEEATADPETDPDQAEQDDGMDSETSDMPTETETSDDESGLYIGAPTGDESDAYEVGARIVDDAGTEYKKTETGWEKTGSQYGAIDKETKEAWNKEIEKAAQDLRGQEAAAGDYTGTARGEDGYSSRLDEFSTQRDTEQRKAVAGAAATMGYSSQLGEAARSGDQQIREASHVRTAGGRDAQTTREESARRVAQTERQTSWGTVIGDAVTEGIQQGGEAFGQTLGASAGNKVAGEIFGSRDDRSKGSAEADGETAQASERPAEKDQSRRASDSKPAGGSSSSSCGGDCSSAGGYVAGVSSSSSNKTAETTSTSDPSESADTTTGSSLIDPDPVKRGGDATLRPDSLQPTETTSSGIGLPEQKPLTRPDGIPVYTNIIFGDPPSHIFGNN